jgi:hypothetical protein
MADDWVGEGVLLLLVARTMESRDDEEIVRIISAREVMGA